MLNITQSNLQDVLTYTPETGEFSWIVPPVGWIYQGDIAGSINKNGYRYITVNKKKYLAHRLVWLYVHGYLPEGDLDHVDRVRTNNKVENLREVSRQCNIRNSPNRVTNTSGVKGVCWCKKMNKWKARITVNYVETHLGCSEDFMEMVCLRLAAEQTLSWEGCDSRSPAYQYVQTYLRRLYA